MAMGVILFVVSVLSFLYGMTTEAAATSAIHQILAGIGILGGIVALAGAGLKLPPAFPRLVRYRRTP